MKQPKYKFNKFMGIVGIKPGEPGQVLTSDNEGKPKFVYTSTDEVPKIPRAINPDLPKESEK